MNRYYILSLVLLFPAFPWGFFGHRLINRVAVYTIPTEMMPWYKPHIDYLSEHAVDPDKRRYASRHEAVRHYIDLDHWGTLPFDHLPVYWDQALALNLELQQIHEEDTTYNLLPVPSSQWKDSLEDFSARLALVRKHYLRQYYEDEATISCDSFRLLFPDMPCDTTVPILIKNVFAEHGIVPYHLQAMQRRLTDAFRDSDHERVLRVSAELGHYIADACVPLHTTSNYNGQLTGQDGIHAFWESRIPELFAIEEFDMLVGTATYISEPAIYFRELVLSSHREVDKVLAIEKELRQTFPEDQQYCFEDKSNQVVRTPCAAYAAAYHLAMNNMVEDRFRVAVKALGDAWYTAWVDAGQPPCPGDNLISNSSSAEDELASPVKTGKSPMREHE
jgi:hypothetical protein